jgi:hypothetical protein
MGYNGYPNYETFITDVIIDNTRSISDHKFTLFDLAHKQGRQIDSNFVKAVTCWGVGSNLLVPDLIDLQRQERITSVEMRNRIDWNHLALKWQDEYAEHIARTYGVGLQLKLAI